MNRLPMGFPPWGEERSHFKPSLRQARSDKAKRKRKAARKQAQTSRQRNRK